MVLSLNNEGNYIGVVVKRGFVRDEAVRGSAAATGGSPRRRGF